MLLCRESQSTWFFLLARRCDDRRAVLFQLGLRPAPLDREDGIGAGNVVSWNRADLLDGTRTEPGLNHVSICRPVLTVVAIDCLASPVRTIGAVAVARAAGDRSDAHRHRQADARTSPRAPSSWRARRRVPDARRISCSASCDLTAASGKPWAASTDTAGRGCCAQDATRETAPARWRDCSSNRGVTESALARRRDS